MYYCFCLLLPFSSVWFIEICIVAMINIQLEIKKLMKFAQIASQFVEIGLDFPKYYKDLQKISKFSKFIKQALLTICWTDSSQFGSENTPNFFHFLSDATTDFSISLLKQFQYHHPLNKGNPCPSLSLICVHSACDIIRIILKYYVKLHKM